MKPILLTGATGFVGSAVLRHLIHAGCPVRVAGRRAPILQSPLIEPVEMSDLSRLTADEAASLVRGTHGVIHAAGYAHAMGGLQDEHLHAAINRDAAIRLAEASAFFGEGVFLFLSSIRAQSAAHAPIPLQETDAPAPTDAYGTAKLAAEEAIRLLLPERHIILRPVLVCGAGAGGNLAQLRHIARLPLPLPFAGLRASRSLIGVEDLAALVVRALLVRQILGKTLIVADPDSLSLAEMITEMRKGLGRPALVFSLPKAMMLPAIRLLLGKEKAERLTGSLNAVPALLTSLGWKPSQGVRAALRAMAL